MLSNTRIFCLLACAVLLANLASAQLTQTTTDVKLSFAVPRLYGASGLTLPNNFHNAHFTSSFQSNFNPVNTALSTQLSLLPIVSPASGFVFSFDRSLGTVTRTSESFGPILSERAETVGRHKLFVGFTYQHYGFDTIDGLDIHKLPSVLNHSDCCGGAGTPGVPTFERDYITTDNDIDLTINQFTWFGTFGLGDRVDLSVALPLVNSNMKVTSAATIVRIAPPDPVFGQAHYFDVANPNGSTQKTFISGGDATGIGDVTFRLKANAWKGERGGLALGFDVRVPSGDEMNFLGSGAAGFRPFMAMSYRGRVSPHFNLGYQWNGESVLGGDPVAGTKGDLPDSFFYSGGVDVGVAKRLTLVFDYLGQHVIDAQRVRKGTFTDSTGKSVPQIGFYKDAYESADGSVGFKLSPANKLLITANVLFRMNDSGLRSNVVPLVGISYTF